MRVQRVVEQRNPKNRENEFHRRADIEFNRGSTGVGEAFQQKRTLNVMRSILVMFTWKQANTLNTCHIMHSLVCFRKI
jgi:hypothetical protein